MMNPSGIIRILLIWFLCVFYCASVGFAVLLKIIFNFKKQPWKRRVHSVPPKCLSNPKYGTHKYMNVNNIKLHYVENGDPNKPLMLFVHGFPEFWYSWRFQIEEFSKDYWTVAIDLRGYGHSDKPKEVSSYKVEHMVEDIRAAIEYLGRKKCILVCHDWGAVIGWSFISKHMDMVSKYVMMGAPSSTVWKKSMARRDQFLKSWYIFYFQMPIFAEFTIAIDDFNIFKNIGNSKFDELFNEEDLEAYKYTFSQPGALTPPLNYYRANFPYVKYLSEPRVTECADGLYILGEKDLYISKSSGPMLQKQFSNLKYEIVPNANHFVQQDQPAIVNKLMRDFLKNN